MIFYRQFDENTIKANNQFNLMLLEATGLRKTIHINSYISYIIIVIFFFFHKVSSTDFNCKVAINFHESVSYPQKGIVVEINHLSTKVHFHEVFFSWK